jgi:hypothetical protein
MMHNPSVHKAPNMTGNCELGKNLQQTDREDPSTINLDPTPSQATHFEGSIRALCLE